MALTHALSTNNYGTAHLIVATSAANGTHTTLASAMADAVSGDTIFLRDSVTEDVTLTAGVNIAAWGGGTLNIPTITGKITFSTAGTCNISGIILKTNSDFAVVVSGSAASILNLNNCFLNALNNTSISFTSSSSSAIIRLNTCRGDLGTTGIGVHSMSSTGSLYYDYCNFTNSGGSTTNSSNSAGNVYIRNSNFLSPFSTSSTGNFTNNYAAIDTSVLNVTSLTTAGTGGMGSLFGYYSGGTASAISIGSGTTLSSYFDSINSSNTNAVTGSGSWSLSGVSYLGSSANNVTTINLKAIQGAQYVGRNINTAPSSTMLGEQIRATVATGSSITLSTGTAANVTSISLTPGIWDVSGMVAFGGGAITGTQYLASINTTSATNGTPGDNLAGTTTSPNGTTDVTVSIPSYRISLSATTTVYLVASANFTVGTAKAYGRISATRVA